MPRQPLRVLISGASVAGPTAAYWLCRQGFAVTVVERMPLTRVRTSGHAVDLFGPAMDVAEWTGVLPAVIDARTRTEIVSFQREHGRGVDVEMRRLVAGISGRHVEIMRGELATILYEATRNDARYLFEDSIRTIIQDPDGVAVTFEHAPADRFDLVIGADGLHSIVRRLAFGPEDRFRRFLGGYLAGAALPNYLGLEGRMVVWNAPGRLAAIYPVHGTGDGPGRFPVPPPPRSRARSPRRRRAEAAAAPDLRRGRVAGSPAAGRDRRRRGLLLRLDQPDRDGQLDQGAGHPGRRRRLLPRPGRGRRHQHRHGRRLRPGSRTGPSRPGLPGRAARLPGPHARARRQGPQHRTQHHVHADPADRSPGPADPGAATPDHPDAAALQQRLFQLQATPARALDSIHLTRSSDEE